MNRRELRDYAQRACDRYDEYLSLTRRVAALRALAFGNADADQLLREAWEGDEHVADATLIAVRLNLGALGVHPEAPVGPVVDELRALLAAIDE